jgi:hypothetical protein
MAALSPALRPLVPVVAAALLGTALLAAWIRLRPLPMPPALQVLLSVGVVVAVAAALALTTAGERAPRTTDDPCAAAGPAAGGRRHPRTWAVGTPSRRPRGATIGATMAPGDCGSLRDSAGAG